MGSQSFAQRPRLDFDTVVPPAPLPHPFISANNLTATPIGSASTDPAVESSFAHARDLYPPAPHGDNNTESAAAGKGSQSGELSHTRAFLTAHYHNIAPLAPSQLPPLNSQFASHGGASSDAVARGDAASISGNGFGRTSIIPSTVGEGVLDGDSSKLENTVDTLCLAMKRELLVGCEGGN